MIIEIEVGIIALAAIVVAGFLVPVLIHLRRAVEESGRLLTNVNRELPTLLKGATSAIETVNDLANDVRAGTEKAKVLGEAIGEIGETVHRVHGAIRTKAATLLMSATGLVAGVRAAIGVLARGSRNDHSGAVRDSHVPY
jgi:uncharacterized protein YoxC